MSVLRNSVLVLLAISTVGTLYCIWGNVNHDTTGKVFGTVLVMWGAVITSAMLHRFSPAPTSLALNGSIVCCGLGWLCCIAMLWMPNWGDVRTDTMVRLAATSGVMSMMLFIASFIVEKEAAAAKED